VLVVDDEPEVGAALAELLDMHGVTVEQAGGGGAALCRHAIVAQPPLRGRFGFPTGDTVAGPAAIAALEPGDAPPILERPFMPEDVAAVLAKLRAP
jgi:CheY-like chemotaxis protein